MRRRFSPSSTLRRIITLSAMNSSTPNRATGSVVLGAFRGEQRRDAHRLQRPRDAEQLAAHDRLIGELREHRAERIDRHALRVHALDRALDAREQRAEVEAPTFDGLDVRDRATRRRPRTALALPRREIPPEAAHVLCGCRRSIPRTSRARRAGPLRCRRRGTASASAVLPLPAVPETSVVRCFGRPPFAMTSKLAIPVGSFSTSSIGRRVVGAVSAVSMVSSMAPAGSQVGERSVPGHAAHRRELRARGELRLCRTGRR